MDVGEKPYPDAVKFSRHLKHLAVIAASAVLYGACGGSGDSAKFTLNNVGRIPGVNVSADAISVEGVTATLSSFEGAVLGTKAAGNRLIVIGDSILAGTASRYGGAMCSALVPMGWRVEVNAEVGRPVAFGRSVLRARLSAGWDAAVVFLGTNYGGNAEKYKNDLSAIVTSLAPRPVLLLTATLFKETMQDVNRVIREVATENDNVSVLDWGTASMQPGLLNSDFIHPTNAGRAVLVQSVAQAVGTAPTSPGACLPTKYSDDSLGADLMTTTTVSDQVVVSPSAPNEDDSTVVTSTTSTPPQTTTTVQQ